MCTVRIGPVRVAKEDIPVWKIFRTHKVQKDALLPLYYHPYGGWRLSGVFVKLCEYQDTVNMSDPERGYGCFPTKRQAVQYAGNFMIKKGIVIVEMVIPRNARYAPAHIPNTSPDGEHIDCYQAERLEEAN